MGVGMVEGRLPLISVQQQADGEFHVQTPESLSVPWFPHCLSASVGDHFDLPVQYSSVSWAPRIPVGPAFQNQVQRLSLFDLQGSKRVQRGAIPFTYL